MSEYLEWVRAKKERRETAAMMLAHGAEEAFQTALIKWRIGRLMANLDVERKFQHGGRYNRSSLFRGFKVDRGIIQYKAVYRQHITSIRTARLHGAMVPLLFLKPNPGFHIDLQSNFFQYEDIDTAIEAGYSFQRVTVKMKIPTAELAVVEIMSRAKHVGIWTHDFGTIAEDCYITFYFESLLDATDFRLRVRQ